MEGVTLLEVYVRFISEYRIKVMCILVFERYLFLVALEAEFDVGERVDELVALDIHGPTKKHLDLLC